MNKNALTVSTTVALVFSGCALYSLNTSAAAQFQSLYSAFGIQIPELTRLVLLSLPYWMLMLSVVAICSYSLVRFCESKVKYLGVLFPIIFPIVILLALYAPTVLLGSVI
jgi:hypothetical protein